MTTPEHHAVSRLTALAAGGHTAAARQDAGSMAGHPLVGTWLAITPFGASLETLSADGSFVAGPPIIEPSSSRQPLRPRHRRLNDHPGMSPTAGSCQVHPIVGMLPGWTAMATRRTLLASTFALPGPASTARPLPSGRFRSAAWTWEIKSISTPISRGIAINAEGAIACELVPMGFMRSHSVASALRGESPRSDPRCRRRHPIASPQGPPHLIPNPDVARPGGRETNDATGICTSCPHVLPADLAPTC